MSQSKFQECIRSGYLEKVSAGEVCTIETAKNMGIANIPKNKHFTSRYPNVRTFNSAKDLAEDRVDFQICSESSSKTRAFPICALQPGAGFGFTEEYDVNQKAPVCVTAECPTSFTQVLDENGLPKNPYQCVKPKLPKTSPIRNHLDERWYDWFTIQDYHLGNKYSSSNEINYRPCPSGNVPFYNIDPVDGATISFEERPDYLDKCVSKADYFGGKYLEESPYCPLSWIMRTGATKKDFLQIYKDQLELLEKKKGIPTPAFTELEKNLPTIIQKEIYEPIHKFGFKEFIAPPSTEEGKSACEILNRDPVRLSTAYNICRQLQENPDFFKEKLIRDNNETQMSMVQAKIERTKQACHAVFCNPENSAVSQLEDGKNVCFPDVEKMNQEALILKAQEEAALASAPAPPITSDKAKILAKESATKGIINIIKLVGFLCFLAVIYYKLWPMIHRFIETKIKPWFTYKHKTALQLDAEEALETQKLQAQKAQEIAVNAEAESLKEKSASVVAAAVPKTSKQKGGRRKK